MDCVCFICHCPPASLEYRGQRPPWQSAAVSLFEVGIWDCRKQACPLLQSSLVARTGGLDQQVDWNW